MHRDDLLNKRCAGSRHADDEDRRCIVIADFGRPRDQFWCASSNKAVDFGRECGRVKRSKAAAYNVSRIEMLHGPSVVAEVIGRLSDGEMKAVELRCFQSGRAQHLHHRLQQTIVIARDAAAPGQIVVAAGQLRRHGDGTLKAFAGFVKTAGLGKQISEQILCQGILRILRQRFSQHQFSFLIAILDQQCARLAEAPKTALSSSRRRLSETGDRLIEMAQRVDEIPGAKPRFGQ